MRCPFCNNLDTAVKDSRPSEDSTAIRRRRSCPACGGRFTTFERIQLRELTVVKGNGSKEPFDRDKIARSVSVATRKLGVDGDKLERAVSAIVRQLESSGEIEIPTRAIGARVMDALMSLNQVAYIRFASVYKNFREIGDFEKFIEKLEPGEGEDDNF
ncbi:MAG: transcriptional regulator NrdR [Alphaproteobacteria bacterium]